MFSVIEFVDPKRCGISCAAVSRAPISVLATHAAVSRFSSVLRFPVLVGSAFPMAKFAKKWAPCVGFQRCVVVSRMRHFYISALVFPPPQWGPWAVGFCRPCGGFAFSSVFSLSGVGGPALPRTRGGAHYVENLALPARWRRPALWAAFPDAEVSLIHRLTHRHRNGTIPIGMAFSRWMLLGGIPF